MRIACAAAVVLVLAACGGSKAPVLAAADLPAIANPIPPLPKSAFFDAGQGQAFTMTELSRSRIGSAATAATAEKLDQAGFASGYRKSWFRDGGWAYVALYRFRDASGAKDGFAALRRVVESSLNRTTWVEVDASGFGDESWAGHASRKQEQIAYLWRASNVVVQAAAGCTLKCTAGEQLPRVARAYADAVDTRLEKAAERG